jgi:hypothetical protein
LCGDEGRGLFCVDPGMGEWIDGRGELDIEGGSGEPLTEEAGEPCWRNLPDA